MNNYSFLDLEYYGRDQITKDELFDSKLDENISYIDKGNFVRHLREHDYTFVKYCHEYYSDLVPVCLETGELSDNTIKGYYFGWYKVKEEFGSLKRKVNCQINRLKNLADEDYENDYLKHLYWIKERGYSLSEAYEKINSFLTSEKYKYLFDSYYDDSWTSEGINKRKRDILNGDYERLSPKFTLKAWVQRGWSEEEAVKKKDEYIAKNNLQHKWGPDSEEVVSPLKIEYWIDKGLSEYEARKKISEMQSERANKRYEKYDEIERRKYIPSCIEYWTERGYSEVEAKEKISEIQSKTTIEDFKERYGKVEGEKRFHEMNRKWRKTLENRDDYDEICKKQGNNGLNQYKTLTELVNYYGELDGKKKYASWYWGVDINSIQEFSEYEKKYFEKGYTAKFYDPNFRERILKEQDYLCGNSNCNKKPKDKLFHLHHIDYDKENDNRKNLIFLCHNCHSKTTNHHNKDYWIKLYKEQNKKFYE